MPENNDYQAHAIMDYLAQFTDHHEADVTLDLLSHFLSQEGYTKNDIVAFMESVEGLP